ncbi:MAG: heparinase II/III family protein [Acidobacteria bacterium]|nr:heparinase II/III family protein [Acidobacteriota bacterium]
MLVNGNRFGHRRGFGAFAVALAVLAAGLVGSAAPTAAQESIPTFAQLLAHKVSLKPALVGVHPRVFVTTAELAVLRQRARTTHKAEWQRALATLVSLTQAPPPPPGSQDRRAQNNVALQIAGTSFAYAIEQDPKYLAAAKTWTLAAIDYEPWGYTFNKPNTDLAAGHLLYAIGWAYDLLYSEFTPDERARIRKSLERHADLVYDAFAPKSGRGLSFTQNHDFIPTSGLAVTALALMGESPNAEKWAVLARAHNHRAGQLLSPDGFYYEGMEYWIFSTPWLVRFLDAWEHSTGENLWDRGQFRNWKYMIAHIIMPDGQTVFDFGDIWQGPLTRAKQGEDYAREYPTGTLKSNFNLLYRVAARFQDPQAQAVAERCAGFGHTNQEEWLTLLWRDPGLKAAPMSEIPLAHHFEDSGVAFYRTSWDASATAFALKAGPPEGHRTTKLLATIPEWRLSSGHAHPDAGSFIIWANGKYLSGDTGYAGQPQARHHNTITIGGQGQGDEGDHDVWPKVDQTALDSIRISAMHVDGARVRIEAEAAGAYLPSAGLVRFHRTFEFDGKDGFVVDDAIETRQATPIQWFLHSDVPIESRGGTFLLGGTAPSLVATMTSPKDGRTSVEKTQLTAPGRPGSITEGPEEQRGYHLKLETPAAATTTIRAELKVVK